MRASSILHQLYIFECDKNVRVWFIIRIFPHQLLPSPQGTVRVGITDSLRAGVRTVITAAERPSTVQGCSRGDLDLSHSEVNPSPRRESWNASEKEPQQGSIAQEPLLDKDEQEQAAKGLELNASGGGSVRSYSTQDNPAMDDVTSVGDSPNPV